MHIPGFAGYRRREDLRTADALLRVQVADRMRRVQDRLENVRADFTRNYQIKLNLVSNPRTPFTFAARLVPMLRESELKMLAKSKNVTGAISTAVKQQLAKKAPKTGG